VTGVATGWECRGAIFNALSMIHRALRCSGLDILLINLAIVESHSRCRLERVFLALFASQSISEYVNVLGKYLFLQVASLFSNMPIFFLMDRATSFMLSSASI